MSLVRGARGGAGMTDSIPTGYLCACGHWFVIVTNSPEEGHIQKHAPRCGRCRQPLVASAYVTFDQLHERLGTATILFKATED